MKKLVPLLIVCLVPVMAFSQEALVEPSFEGGCGSAWTCGGSGCKTGCTHVPGGSPDALNNWICNDGCCGYGAWGCIQGVATSAGASYNVSVYHYARGGGTAGELRMGCSGAGVGDGTVIGNDGAAANWTQIAGTWSGTGGTDNFCVYNAGAPATWTPPADYFDVASMQGTAIGDWVLY